MARASIADSERLIMIISFRQVPQVLKLAVSKPDLVASAFQKFTALTACGRAQHEDVTASNFSEPGIMIDPAFFLMGEEFGNTPGRQQDVMSAYRLFVPRCLRAVAIILTYWPVERHGNLSTGNVWHRSTQLRPLERVIELIAQSPLIMTSVFHGLVIALITAALRSDRLLDRLNSTVGKNTYRARRLIVRAELEAWGSKRLDSLPAPGDIGRARIAILIGQTRDWLLAAIRAGFSETRKAAL